MADAFRALLDVDAGRLADLGPAAPALDVHLPMAVPRLISAGLEGWGEPYRRVVDLSEARSCEASAQPAAELSASQVSLERRRLVWRPERAVSLVVRKSQPAKLAARLAQVARPDWSSQGVSPRAA